MRNPIEIILLARKRLARLAAIRTLLLVTLPLSVTVAVALGLDAMNRLAFYDFGYLIDVVPARIFQASLLALAVVELAAVGLFAWRAWVGASDFIRAAEHIDQCVGGRQEIVTLASFSNPSEAESTSSRSPLFPILWNRAITYLEEFDPRTAFRLEFREPLIRSSILAALALVVLSTAAFALMIHPTALQSVSHRLQLLARTIHESPGSPGPQQLAAAARDVAKDLANPKLPPQEKIAELQALEHELDKSRSKPETGNAGKGNSSGGGNGGGNGVGQGSDSNGASGSGNSSGASRTGSGASKGNKADQQMVELQNDIAKAKLKLEQETAVGNQTRTAQNNSSQGTGSAPKQGSNPNQPGGQTQSNGSGQVPQSQTLANAQRPSGQSPGGPRNSQGSMGDTHLGEFPKPGNYQRFYKPGEGPAINLRDARYVTFQLPTATELAGAGMVVSDNTRPQATTPYTNTPLKLERLPVSPDEQQLMPPRYRELIR